MDKKICGEKIKEYVDKLVGTSGGLTLYKEYEEYFPHVDGEIIFDAFHAQMQKGNTMEDILAILPKAVKLFVPHLEPIDESQVDEDSFLGILLEENRGMTQRLEQTKKVFIRDGFSGSVEKTKELVKDIGEYISHFEKKEQILFAKMEQKHKRYEGLAIMWALHYRIREYIKECSGKLDSKDLNSDEFSVIMGKLFFYVYGSIEKEHYILFPEALRILDKSEWDDMTYQCREYDLAFIDRKPNLKKVDKPPLETDYRGLVYSGTTGKLSFEQLEGILKVLPVDLSFVDENNKLVFFSDSKDRIFPRSPASLGREVKNCHPPKSYPIVERIIEEFREGRQEEVSFWINMKGRKILISYYAIRDSENKYKGVLEATQDITDIQKISGEKRILDF